jgi:hypothetical protein
VKQSRSGSKSHSCNRGILLIASMRAFAFTIADLDPSRRYKLESSAGAASMAHLAFRSLFDR